MVFEYTVKYNGIYYPAGVDVPMENKQNETAKTVTVVKFDKPVEEEKPKSEGRKTKRKPKD